MAYAIADVVRNDAIGVAVMTRIHNIRAAHVRQGPLALCFRWVAARDDGSNVGFHQCTTIRSKNTQNTI